ncbi:MAG: hypothetical protein ABIZ09_02590 [Rhodoferax sp.]
MKIALVGARGTGKSTLATALQGTFQTQTQAFACTVVDQLSQEPYRSYDLVLLMGLDLPSALDPDHRQMVEKTDHQLRQFMDTHVIPYAVVYGSGQARVDHAFQTIEYHRSRAANRRSLARKASEWQWCCDTCSDAACEHRLFTALVSRPPSSVRP